MLTNDILRTKTLPLIRENNQSYLLNKNNKNIVGDINYLLFSGLFVIYYVHVVYMLVNILNEDII